MRSIWRSLRFDAALSVRSPIAFEKMLIETNASNDSFFPYHHDASFNQKLNKQTTYDINTRGINKFLA